MKVPTTGKAEEREARFKLREHLLPPKLRELRQKLRTKAKQEPGYRFYSLYGRVVEPEVLRAAWAQVRANQGAPGEDGVSIEELEKSEESLAGFLSQLAEELKSRGYRPGPVRRVYIPKPDGRKRPLGIPNLRDRVVQTAVLLVLEPIFEADFLECSYGFRPARSAQDAVKQIEAELKAGRTQVYDADLQGYFDTIPHDRLMACVKQRVTDGSILRLIRAWLEAPVVSPPERPGGSPTIKRNRQGTPQGGVISPLLANVYLHWFDKVFHRPDGPAQFAGAKLVRYADDFVILARYMGPRITGWVERKLEGWFRLKLNREKTRVIMAEAPGQTVDFLGYSFRYERDLYGRDRHWWRLFPSKKTVLRQHQWLRDNLNAKHCGVPLPEMIEHLNEHYRGWKTYFRLGHPRRELRALNHAIVERLRGHLSRRSQRAYQVPAAVSLRAHLQSLGLVML